MQDVIRDRLVESAKRVKAISDDKQYVRQYVEENYLKIAQLQSELMDQKREFPKIGDDLNAAAAEISRITKFNREIESMNKRIQSVKAALLAQSDSKCALAGEGCPPLYYPFRYP